MQGGWVMERRTWIFVGHLLSLPYLPVSVRVLWVASNRKALQDCKQKRNLIKQYYAVQWISWRAKKTKHGGYAPGSKVPSRAAEHLWEAGTGQTPRQPTPVVMALDVDPNTAATATASPRGWIRLLHWGHPCQPAARAAPASLCHSLLTQSLQSVYLIEEPPPAMCSL